MLRSLHIRDFVIVDEVEIDFAGGFTVLSGETGAGKSILIDALALAMGDRADAGVVREGAARADVSAVFDVDAGAAAWLSALELDAGEALILRRVVDAQGRSKAWVNGATATVGQLREIGERLVDIHGQHAHQALLRADAQRALLDEHAGLAPVVAQAGKLFRAWRGLAQRVEGLERDSRSIELERERLSWQAEELRRLALGDGEWDAIQAEHARLAHAAALIEGAQAAHEALDPDDEGVIARLDPVIARLQGLAAHDPALAAIALSLDSVRIGAREVARDLATYLNRTGVDPERLREVDSRMQAIHASARRLRTTPALLPALSTELEAQLAALADAGDLDALRAQAARALQDYRDAAESLGRQRRAAAAPLSDAVTAAMQTLGMTGGRFDIAVEAADPGPQGTDRVDFLVAPHSGAAPRPLAKVVSGGELSRIALALSVIASNASRVPTLIFDEVDSGIGGAVAEIVGKRLRDLGSRHQVLCVTHLPQVAAQGNQHLVVSKETDGDGTRSLIRALPERERVDEIARMLGGVEITATTRKHAREMLAA